MEGSCEYTEYADKGWSSSLGVRRGANNSSPKGTACYEMMYRLLFFRNIFLRGVNYLAIGLIITGENRIRYTPHLVQCLS
jgi:hypothetical protein